MPSNLIISRVAAFLSAHAPFSLIGETERERISGTVEIIYHEDKKVIFREGDPAGNSCYLVRKGKVNLFRNHDGKEVLMDVCGEGDLFGVRSMLSEENYKLTAVVDQEALLYALPVRLLRELIDRHAAVGRFFAVGLATGQVIIGHQEAGNPRNEFFNRSLNREIAGILPWVLERGFAACRPEERVRDVAKKMALKEMDSALILDVENHPVGIITDTDLRKQVATGETGIDQPVKKIMHFPVITIGPGHRQGDIVLKMMQEGIHHLCITEDGTAGSTAKGIVSDHDLVMLQGTSPTSILRAIGKAGSMMELKAVYSESDKIIHQLVLDEAPLNYLLEVASTFRDVLIQKWVALYVEGVPELRGGGFCFADLGSAARKEQVMKTDLDNLMIYANGREQLKIPLIRMAEQLNQFLNDIGFDYCKAGTMAHLPSMCLSYEKWVQKMTGWIHSPDPTALLNATIYFDMRALAGDAMLIDRLKEHITGSIREQPSFLNFLARNAVQNPPPLSFFNQFIVETSGEHKNEFDIKKRALMPIVDAGRLLALEHQYYGSVATLDRLRKVSQLEPGTRSVFAEAIHGFEYLIRMRAENGLRQGDDGRYVDIASFGNIDKKIFKEIFHVIREIQKLIRVRFQLDYFR